ETDVAFVSPKILQLLEEWSSIDSQMQDELYKNESHSNVDIIQSQANQHINSDFIEKELHELIDMLQNKLSGAKLSNQERLRFADWINILSGLDASLSSSSILSLLEKIEGELEQLTNDQKLNHPKRAPLHIRLSKLITTLNNGEMTNKAHDALSKGQQVTKETALWKELVQVYQKRKSLASTYRTDASVQSKDVSKWLSNAIEGQTATAKVVNPTSVSFTSLPMSKIEQYVIHLNHTQSGSSVEQQIIDKFQKIMQTSKFLSQPNGRMQLSLSLRPENLGDMMVRFVQIDGEMAVKITVSSQAAKEILEKNSHQLRNVFSPHQVVIERQELNLQSANELQQNHHEEEESGEQQEEQHQNQDDDQHENEDFEMFLQEILMNEKV